MKPFLRSQLERYAQRLGELDFLLSREDIMSDMAQYRRISVEHAEVTQIAGRYARYQQREADLAGAREMLSDPDMAEMAQEEITSAEAELLQLEDELQRLLLPKDPDDARRLVKPGDVVLVDDPGYPNLHFMLRFAGAQVVGVPRTPTGYDLPALEALLAAHRPTVFFTQPRLQSPTCSMASVAHLHRLLQLAEQHGFALVENDIYADMDSTVRPSLASLDQLSRVVYIGSFSKTISPNLRTGYVAARRDLLDELVQLKMISGLTSSEITERITFGVVTDGRWRKHLKSLREGLAEAHRAVGRRMLNLGFELFHEPEAGMYLWARTPICPSSAT